MAATGTEDAFLLKLGPSGYFMWEKRIGGNLQNWGASVALDGGNHVYIGGQWMATADLNPCAGALSND